MNIAEFIVYSIIVAYSLTIFLFNVGWYRIKTFKTSKSKIDNNVSIVVACRNEEKNISSLLEKLFNQTYDKEKVEILIIDDHSEDGTVSIIETYAKKFKFIKLLRLPHKNAGKKEAITLGIKNAQSKIIITTDADCTMNKDWIYTMLCYYNQFKPKLIVGPVTFINEKSLFSKVQSLEFLSLVGSGAGAIGINRAIMNNGANLLFEKSVFLKSNLNNEYASGDDAFLMLRIKKNHKNEIQFLKSKDAIVYTKAEKTIRSLFNQRIRWTSKSKAYRDFDIIMTAIIVAITNFSLVFALVYSFFNSSFFITLILLLSLKSIFDLGILIPVSKFFNQQKLLWLFIPLQIIYPIYILITVVLGLVGNFYWKGRNFQEKG